MWCNNLFWTNYEWPAKTHRFRLSGTKCSSLEIVIWTFIRHQKVCKQRVSICIISNSHSSTTSKEENTKVVRAMVEILVWEAFNKPGKYKCGLEQPYFQLSMKDLQPLVSLGLKGVPVNQDNLIKFCLKTTKQLEQSKGHNKTFKQVIEKPQMR